MLHRCASASLPALSTAWFEGPTPDGGVQRVLGLSVAFRTDFQSFVTLRRTGRRPRRSRHRGEGKGVSPSIARRRRRRRRRRGAWTCAWAVIPFALLAMWRRPAIAAAALHLYPVLPRTILFWSCSRHLVMIAEGIFALASALLHAPGRRTARSGHCRRRAPRGGAALQHRQCGASARRATRRIRDQRPASGAAAMHAHVLDRCAETAPPVTTSTATASSLLRVGLKLLAHPAQPEPLPGADAPALRSHPAGGCGRRTGTERVAIPREDMPTAGAERESGCSSRPLIRPNARCSTTFCVSVDSALARRGRWRTPLHIAFLHPSTTVWMRNARRWRGTPIHFVMIWLGRDALPARS